MEGINKIIEDLNLNLEGLCVITEAASKEYQLMPLIAAKAGATVFALGKNSKYGSFLEIKDQINNLAKSNGVDDRINVIHYQEFSNWGVGDIITNSGMIRPIDENIVVKLKKTAVIPLLWETWEFRPHEIDLSVCQKNKIPVIGTNEGFKKISMFHYPGMLAKHILTNLRVDYSSDRIVVIGGELPGTLIANDLRKINDSIIWFADDYREDLTSINPIPYSRIQSVLNKKNVKAILLTEHQNKIEILGSNGLLNYNSLIKKSEKPKIGHLCGNVDIQELYQSGLEYYPKNIADFGYLSILPNIFGDTPMIKLFSAGLKVGELASKARIKGASIKEAIKETTNFGIGQDFVGGFENFKHNG